MSITKGQTVRFRIDNKKVFGTVETEPTATPSGQVVSVKLLPDFSHLTPTGWTDASVDELTAVKVCACAHLAYRPIFGDHKGELFTTGCDFSRMPSRSSKFLPGHDAKAKGFLIKASGQAQKLENGKSALETARELGDKISLAVAKGMDNARQRGATAARSKRRSTKTEAAPAKPEDQLTETQKLWRELGVTEAMLRPIIRAAVDDLPGFRGYVTAPAGTELAIQKRGLTSYGYLTDLGYKVAEQPTFAEQWPDAVTCKDETGSYEKHAPRYNDETFVRECKRCGAEVPQD